MIIITIAYLINVRLQLVVLKLDQIIINKIENLSQLKSQIWIKIAIE